MASRIGGTPTLNSVQKSGATVYTNATGQTIINAINSGGTEFFALKTESSQQGAVIYINTASGSVVWKLSSTGAGYTTQPFAIGTNSVNASAAFQVNSTTKGILLPVMTTTQKNAISSPAEGLIVYDLTEHKPYVYNGTSWESLL